MMSPWKWKVLLMALAAVAAILSVGIAYFRVNGHGRSLARNVTTKTTKSGNPAALPATQSGPRTFLLSEDPLIVYIKDFITPTEAAHLVSLADGHFVPSILWDDSGRPHRDKAYRSSMTARLPAQDQTIERIEARARAFSFYRNVGSFQRMVAQNYGIAGQYRDHFDWYDDAHAVGGNVASTFFVYIYTNCTGGGTNFPRLPPPPETARTQVTQLGETGPGHQWCEFIDCDRPVEDGTTFLPMLGNAVYWENIDFASGIGHPKTLHAGMPVTSGNKIGLNMWTWQTSYDLCKKRKLRCVPSQDGGSCLRCAGAELRCVFDAPSRQTGREKTENSNNDQLGLLLSELTELRRQVGDLAGAVQELRQSVNSNSAVKNVPSLSHGRAFADSPNTQAPGLRRKPQFMGPTRPDFDFQIGERALHRMGIPLVSSDSDGEAVAHSCSQSPAPSTPRDTSTAAAAVAVTAEASARGSSRSDLRWTTDEIVRLLGVYDEDVNSVFPCIDVADLAAQPQAIRDDVLRCLRQQESVLLPDTRASAGAGDAALARVVIATAVVLEARGRNAVSEMLVSPVERNVSCIASPEPDMKEVQLLAVLSIYYFHIDQDLLAWRAISVAAHETLEMGLHRKQSLLENYKSSDARRLATRVFWVVYVLDRRWSLGISLPFTLRDRDLDPELPEPGPDSPYLQSMVGYGRLCSQLWDAIPVLSGGGGAGQQPPLQEDQVALLDLRVQEWLTQIPAELQLRHPRLGLAPRAQPHVLHRLRTLLYLRANSLRILLHRHRLRSPTAVEADPHGAWLVVDIAMDSIQVLFHLNETTDIYARQQRAFNYFLLSALAVLFLAVCHAPRIFTEPCRRSFGDAVSLIRCFSHDRTVSRRLWRSIRGLLPALRRLGLHEDSQKAAMSASASRAPSATISVATAATAGTGAVAPVASQYVEAHNPGTTAGAGDTAGHLHMWNDVDPYMQMGNSLYDNPVGGPVPDMIQVDTDLLTLFDIFGQGQQLDEGLHADVFADGPLVGEGGGISQRFQWLI